MNFSRILVETEGVIYDGTSASGWPIFKPGAVSSLARCTAVPHLTVLCFGTGSSDLGQFLAREGIRVNWIEDNERASCYQDPSCVVIGLHSQAEKRHECRNYLNFTDYGSWESLVSQVLFPPRTSTLQRKTKETEIELTLNLDGAGKHSIRTGLAFFDHMLDQLSRHSGVDLTISVRGDLNVDEHHTIEDTALALGEAFERALGDKRGITRYAFVLPMDDCLAQVAVDFSGRPWLVWDALFTREKIGDMPTEMFFHFFKSFADTAKLNLNVKVEGQNEHHKIESIFKALGRCIGQAVKRGERFEVPSTKGIL
jgi:imidazoleglycerol phosphate dehydratase HisB